MKLLLTIIQKHCPKAPTKDINIPGRTTLGVQRRFEGLRKSHPLDDSGNITGFNVNSNKNILKTIENFDEDYDDEPVASPAALKKRKTTPAKKGTAKKVKKEAGKPKHEDEDEKNAIAAFDEEVIGI